MQRYFADTKKTDETVFPGSQTTKHPLNDLPPPPSVTTPSNPIHSAAITPENVPKTPPPPPAQVKSENVPNPTTPPTPLPPTGTGSASVAPPPSPSPKKTHRFRKFLIYMTLVLTLGYAGGTYYALVSDNWHDFWTEYVPFGEDAVAYFEEREFRKRFHQQGLPTTRLHEQIKGEPKVRIGRAGMTAKPVAGEDDSKKSDLSKSGRHLSAVDDAASKPAAPSKPVEEKKESTTHKLLPQDEKKTESPAPPAEKKAATPAPKPEAKPEPKPVPPAPKVEPIDHLTVSEGTEPAVQDAVKMLNDIITVINADGNAALKYSSAIATAKSQLEKLITNVSELKAVTDKAAEDREKKLHEEFDGMAKELLRRQEAAIRDQEMRWKEEYEEERGKLAETYEGKLKAELESVQKLYEQKLKNELLEQQIALKRDFSSSVKSRVESEREGRLGQLDKLSGEVEELERLTAQWNGVVESNLKTQHLLVAVEALRSTLEKSTTPRPFIEELAALKEVANGDPVIDAAIASINPTSYQRGIPSSAQLVDRFRRVATEVRKVELLPADAGIVSHAASAVLSRFMFRKDNSKGVPVGDDVESVIARAEALLEEGRLEDACREVNALGGWAKVLCRDWLGDVRRVLEVRNALDVSSPSSIAP